MKENSICFIDHAEVYEYSDLPKKFNKNSMDEYLIFLKDKKIECKNFPTLKIFLSFMTNHNSTKFLHFIRRLFTSLIT